MPQQVINIGSSPNDGTGDPLRTAFDKCNDNFTELYAGGGGGSGGVSSVSVVAANGVSGVVANPTTTPAITLTLGAITPATVNGITMLGAASPQLTVIGTSAVTGNNTGDQNLFSKIAVAGEADVVADSPTDTLTLVAGANVILTTNAANDEITISSTGGGGGGAPINADYLVRTANASLTNERVVSNSTSVNANWATAGQVTFERAALTGDVTASTNSNSTTIAAGVVNTSKLGGDITAAGKALLDDADAAAQRTTLGLGSLATLSTVPYSSVDNVITNRILARSSPSTGAAEILTTSNVLDFISSTQGTMLYRASGQWFGLGPSTTGYVLQTNGAGANPTWGQVNLATAVTGDLPLSNLAQASTGSILLGRGAGAGAGDFQEITLGTNLSMTGTVLNASGGSGGGNVSGPASPITDNALVRWDLTNTQIQNSGVTLSDTQEMSGLKSVTFNTAGGTVGLAKMVWDTTNQTIDLGIGSGSVNALLGVDRHVLGRNTTGSLISRGQVVRVNGASAGNLTIALAQGNTDPNTTNTIGIAAEDIANTATGMVITSGLLRDLNTATFATGDLLYISPTTAGLMVNTIPAAPNHAVRMGYVVSAHPSNGIIYVAVNNGYELNELHDVNYPTTPATNDFLVYVTNRWENQTAATARTSMGLGSLATLNTVPYSSVDNIVSSRILGRSSAGTGVSELLTASNVLDFVSSTQGTLLYRASGQWFGLGPSTAGYVLTTNGAAANPSWGQVSLSSAVTGTLPVGNGGTGATTLTGYVKGNATSAFTASSTIPTSDITGLATVATSGSASDLSTGTLPAGRLPAFTGDVTTTAGTAATTIGANKVQYSMIQQVPALTVVGNGGSATADVGSITGTAGQVLRINNGGTALAFGAVDLSTAAAITGTLGIANGGTGQTTQTNAFDALAPTTTKGDLILHNGTDNVRLAVGGTNGHVLTVDSTTATGVKWAAAGGGSGGSTNVWIPAAQWIPRTTTGCGIDSRELSTNKINTDELLFDPGTAEYAQCMIVMPSNWNAGTITAKFHWTASTGSGDVVWGLRGRAYANDDALDQAMGTGQTATDTLTATNDLDISPATSAITLGGTAASGNPVIFELYRDAAAGGDTLGSDARLLGVEISYTAS